MIEKYFHEAPIAVMQSDSKGRILFVNGMMESMLQMQKNNILGGLIFDHIQRKDHPQIHQILRDPILCPQALLGVKKGDQTIQVTTSVSPIEQNLLWFWEDNTILQTLEKENQRYQTFPKEYGHNINNLLTVILSAAQLIEMDIEEDSPLQEDLDDITTAANRAALQTRLFMNMGRQSHIQFQHIHVSEFMIQHQEYLKTLSGMTYVPPKDFNHWIFGNSASLLTALTMSIGYFRDIDIQTRLVFDLQLVVVTEPFASQSTGLMPEKYVCFSIFDEGFEMLPQLLVDSTYIENDEAPLLFPVWDIIIRLRGSLIQRKTPQEQRSISLYIPLSPHKMESV